MDSVLNHCSLSMVLGLSLSLQALLEESGLPDAKKVCSAQAQAVSLTGRSQGKRKFHWTFLALICVALG